MYCHDARALYATVLCSELIRRGTGLISELATRSIEASSGLLNDDLYVRLYASKGYNWLHLRGGQGRARDGSLCCGTCDAAVEHQRVLADGSLCHRDCDAVHRVQVVYIAFVNSFAGSSAFLVM